MSFSPSHWNEPSLNPVLRPLRPSVCPPLSHTRGEMGAPESAVVGVALLASAKSAFAIFPFLPDGATQGLPLGVTTGPILQGSASEPQSCPPSIPSSTGEHRFGLAGRRRHYTSALLKSLRDTNWIGRPFTDFLPCSPLQPEVLYSVAPGRWTCPNLAVRSRYPR